MFLTSVCLLLIDLAINIALLKQSLVVTDRGNAAVVHDYYHIRPLDRRHALRDNNLGGLGNVGSKPGAYQRVGTRIDGTRRVVENEYLRMLEQCAGYAESLLLTAGNVCASLLYPGFIAVRE